MDLPIKLISYVHIPNLYIYKTETFETSTIFHGTILKNNNNNKTFLNPKPNALLLYIK